MDSDRATLSILIRSLQDAKEKLESKAETESCGIYGQQSLSSEVFGTCVRRLVKEMEEKGMVKIFDELPSDLSTFKYINRYHNVVFDCTSAPVIGFLDTSEMVTYSQRYLIDLLETILDMVHKFDFTNILSHRWIYTLLAVDQPNVVIKPGFVKKLSNRLRSFRLERNFNMDDFYESRYREVIRMMWLSLPNDVREELLPDVPHAILYNLAERAGLRFGFPLNPPLIELKKLDEQDWRIMKNMRELELSNDDGALWQFISNILKLHFNSNGVHP